LRWFIEDVWCCFDDDHAPPGGPLFFSERRNADGSAARVANEALRSALAAAAAGHLPDWPGKITPHVLRHLCASQLYLGGMDLVAIQQTLGHAWIATTMNYINSRELHQPGEINECPGDQGCRGEQMRGFATS
jgi:integrase